MSTNVTDRAKHVLATVAVIGLVVLLAMLFWAQIAYAAAGFLSTPIGTEPTGPVLTWKVAHVEPITYRPAPKPVQKALRQPTRLPSAKPAGGCYAEPGTPPRSVMMRESGGNPRIWNGMKEYSQESRGFSSASGCWGFVRGTWGNYKGYRNAADAPVEVQNERAKQVYAGGAGRSHWSQTHP